MRYNIHLWQLDETGHWTKYAVGRKSDGSVTNERDTEATNPPLVLIDAHFGFGIPTPDTARCAISVFNGIVRGCLPTAETRKVVNESGGINIDAALSLLNPTPPIQGGDTVAEGMGGCFISALLSYPRFITPNGEIEIGGVDYLDLWQDNKPLPHVRFTTPEETLAEERRKRGGFDETVAAFCDTVRWIGEATRTGKAARCAIGKINALVRAFASLGFTDILHIDELANEAAEALQAMCEELAGRKDAQHDAPEPTTDAAMKLETIANGVDFLVQYRKQKIKGCKNRGKANQEKGDREEADRAARDMADALKKIAADPDVKAGKHGAIIAACRKLCDWKINGVKHYGRFRNLTSKRNADGSFAEYAPLTDKSGKPISPETLAKRFRENRGTRKERAMK